MGRKDKGGAICPPPPIENIGGIITFTLLIISIYCVLEQDTLSSA